MISPSLAKLDIRNHTTSYKEINTVLSKVKRSAAKEPLKE